MKPELILYGCWFLMTLNLILLYRLVVDTRRMVQRDKYRALREAAKLARDVARSEPPEEWPELFDDVH